MSIVWIGKKCRRGKKDRGMTNLGRTLIKGILFKYGYKRLLTDEEAKKIGLTDEAMSAKIRHTLMINHGVAFEMRDDGTSVIPVIENVEIKMDDEPTLPSPESEDKGVE